MPRTADDMSDEIAPALTPEEWAEASHEPALPDRFRCGIDTVSRAIPVLYVRDSVWRVAVPSGSRHALAALALHGQQFGFAHEDVDNLRQAIALGFEAASTKGPQQEIAYRECSGALRALAKIAAFLPPETT